MADSCHREEHERRSNLGEMGGGVWCCSAGILESESLVSCSVPRPGSINPLINYQLV